MLFNHIFKSFQFYSSCKTAGGLHVWLPFDWHSSTKKAKYIFGIWNKSDVSAGFCIPHAQIPQPSFLPVWQLRNLFIFFSEAHAFHASLGFCSTWTYFVSIFKSLWKNTQSPLTFLILYMIPQSFGPLPDRIRIFGLTSMYLMKGKGAGLDLSHSSGEPPGVLDCSSLLGSKIIQRNLRNKIFS